MRIRVLCILIMLTGFWLTGTSQARFTNATQDTSGFNFTEIAKLVAFDGQYGDALSNVSLDGDTVVVGAQLADIDSDVDRGAAYIFYRNQGGANNWGFVKKLIASDGTAENFFGIKVSISGDTIVVGAYYADGGGAAYVYERNYGGPNNWGEVKKLTVPIVDGETFGIAAIDGDTIVVGDPAEDIDLGEPYAPGAAYIFSRNQGGANNWGFVKKLSSPDSAVDDFFGIDVAVSEDLVVVSAPNADSIKGAAFLFSRNIGGENNWGFVKKLTASDGVSGDSFGYRVAADGDHVVVSAIFAEIGTNTSQGAAYVFNRNLGGSDHWGEVIKLTASDGMASDRLSHVAINGDLIVTGARRASVGDNDGQGTAYIYEQNEGGIDNWGEIGKLTASDGASGDRFGHVAVNASTIIVGASYADIGENLNQGAAYVFYLSDVQSVFLPLIIR